MKTTIQDNQSLTGAKNEYREIPVYDDGYGPIFLFGDSMRLIAIIRARTWGEAWEIAEDEFFPESDETAEELQREYGFRRKHVKIVRDASGTERPVTDADYIEGRLSESVTFVRWETVETPDPEAWTENELFQEAYGFRPSGPNIRDVQKHGIYAKDLNGDWLHKATPEELERHGITLEIVTEE